MVSKATSAFHHRHKCFTLIKRGSISLETELGSGHSALDADASHVFIEILVCNEVIAQNAAGLFFQTNYKHPASRFPFVC